MKMNKKLILLLVLVLITSVLGGCSNTPKAPDNFDKDLWKDSVKIVSIIYKTYEKDDNFSVKDEDLIEAYFDTYQGRQYNNSSEYEIIKLIQNLYKEYKGYLTTKRTFSDISMAEKDKEIVDELFQEIRDKYELLTK